MVADSAARGRIHLYFRCKSQSVDGTGMERLPDKIWMLGWARRNGRECKIPGGRDREEKGQEKVDFAMYLTEWCLGRTLDDGW